MTITNLKVFVEVYRTGKITAAAEKLNMTQPAATRAVKELEEEFGTYFFERIRKRLFVTDAGRRFYAYASHILDNLDSLSKELSSWDFAGTVKVGATNTLGNFLLPGALNDFSREYPGVQVLSTVARGSVLYSKMETNELDFVLLENAIIREDFVFEPLGEDRLIYVLNSAHPLAGKNRIKLEDTFSEYFLVREKGSVGRFLFDNVYEHAGVKPRICMESESTEALIRGVINNLGIALLPLGFLSAWKDDSRLVFRNAEDDTLFVRHNDIVRHRNKHLTTADENLITIIKEQAQRYYADLNRIWDNLLF